MRVDLSTAPPRCDHCILGKQTRSAVPKTWEVVRASCQLEWVFVDLCGPMPCASQSSCLYSINVINDFSSYCWSLPLRLKDEAAVILQSWHRAVENQSGQRLKILVTDNGELVSKSMQDWCSMHGINHQTTAPYTSAHNGCAEHLHRTLLGKAWAMWLSCNAPTYLWDEFCVTSAYLTNLTASTTLQGKMPYEAWTGRVPSLSHLREISCHAFTLIQTHNPKIYQRSRPCILVGYAPHAKAYRLSDMTSGAVFNSFHVTFLEHLDCQPIDLLPGTTVTLHPDAPPSWDSSPQHSDSPSIDTASCITLLPQNELTENSTDNSPHTIPSPLTANKESPPNLSTLQPSSYNTPPLCCSSWTCTPSSRVAMNDGLLPNH
jgi:transposase InsO family protein